MLLLPDQIKAMSSIDTSVPAGADFDGACRFLGESLKEICNAPIAFIEFRSGLWRQIGASGEVPAAHLVVRALRRSGTRWLVPDGTTVSVAGAVV